MNVSPNRKEFSTGAVNSEAPADLLNYDFAQRGPALPRGGFKPLPAMEQKLCLLPLPPQRNCEESSSDGGDTLFPHASGSRTSLG